MEQTTTPAPQEVDFQQAIIDTLRDAMARGEEIDLAAMAVQLDLDASMKKVRDFVVNGQIATQKEWDAALRVSNVVRELGFYPTTAVELVARYIEENSITVNYQKQMRVSTKAMLDGVTVPDDARADIAVDSYCRVHENKDVNTSTLCRDLRVICSKLKLRFSKMEIDDAVSKWFDDSVQARVWAVFETIDNGEGKGMNEKWHKDNWAAVVSQFDTTGDSPELIEAVLKKFIWQVKRKMLNLPVTNHLMPVILGPQGVGKSTFVRKHFLWPIEELTVDSDFNMLEDTRNFEQWRNYAMFLDEMGFAAKANIDNVKNKITAPTVTARPLYGNDFVQFRQNATFIGCSNKELDQLIRDETGNRRFVALRFSSTPDWSLTEKLDAIALWKSVSPYQEDPSLGVMDELKRSQAIVREQSQVEQWLEQHHVPTALHGKSQLGQELYKEYKEWAEVYFGNRIFDLPTWGKEFTRLINSGQVQGWMKPKTARSTYRYL